ncbi:hypothetical protein DPMN_181055 [Dreissena polymorpha]|uniref:Uncharacterized protein n=1 Tax=Dreissena polymorpha TaxID=45954 RepID=A0A9D4DDQ1_DREPO|nr:hypothetical protein DPMN_181055 [Dreissena polymorpha]
MNSEHPSGHVFQQIGTIFVHIQGTIKTYILTKFHEDCTINVTFMSVNKKNKTAPPPGGHVFSLITTIFKLNQDIHKTNVLTKFHDDWTKNVTSRIFLPIQTIFKLNGCIQQTNAKNVTSRVPPPGGHVFLPIRTIFELTCRIEETNVLTKLHEDWAKNVSFRLFTCLHYIHTEKTAPPPGGHVFPPIMTIFKLVRDINETNDLTKFHDDWAIIVTSRVFTRNTAPPPGGHVFQWTRTTNGTESTLDTEAANICGILALKYLIWRKPTNQQTNQPTNRQGKNNMSPTTIVEDIKMPRPRGGHVFQPTSIIFELFQDIIRMNLLTEKNAPPLGSHVFQANVTILEIIQNINKTNLLTVFHEDWTINVASRVLTRKNALPPWWPYIIGTNLLTKFHEDRKINVASRENAPTPGGHVFQPTCIIFKLVQDIIGMNLLNKFHEDWTINVVSRVKNAPPLGSHVFQANVSIFELIQDIIETNLLNKFHEDWTINVASRELTMQMLTAQDGRRTTDKRRSQKLTMSTMCSAQDINGTNVPTKYHESEQQMAPWQPYMSKFHEDWEKNVSSRLFTCCHSIHIKKTAPLPGGHDFSLITTIFKLVRDIHITNVLTKFHDD